MKIISTIFLTFLSFYLCAQVSNVDCNDTLVIKCDSKIQYPQRQKGNTFYGCWQTIIDSNYTELLFTNDSLYAYNKNGRENKVLNYSITDSEIIFKENEKEGMKCSYIIENLKIIQFNCLFNFIWGSDTIVYNPEFKTQRIDYQEYTYDKVNCWGKMDKKSGCFIQSEDAVKYHNAFINRMLLYKP